VYSKTGCLEVTTDQDIYTTPRVNEKKNIEAPNSGGGAEGRHNQDINM
jgi:hypothetical protein